MVKAPSFTLTAEAWFAHVSALRSRAEVALLQKALGWTSRVDPDLSHHAIMMAERLMSMNLESETLTAALLYPAIKMQPASLEPIADAFGVGVSRLLHDTLLLQSLSQCQQTGNTPLHQVENIRKMLIGMVTDIRTVLIVLAERLVQLRESKSIPAADQAALATETLTIHAPLANRIGAFELKWELEDLSLRILEPDVYHSIAKALSARRSVREAYVSAMKDQLTRLLKQHGFPQADIQGRVKHVYSIYQKMKRKKMPFEAICDVNALRIVVDDIDACYGVLSVIQNTYKAKPEAFEDYIAQPKANGYRSIHMVIDDHGQIVEIQIRSRSMHEEAELGAASHWRYKEGVSGVSPQAQKIALLRQIIAWQKELSQDEKAPLQKDIFADRVYVFTPQGDIVDLPQGATPIDFAYAIHSEVGHRCRGAKVDQKMVALTTPLQTGNRVEIITAKTASPSRDWMNPQLGYTVTPRARSVIQHWFRTNAPVKEGESPEKRAEKSTKQPERPPKSFLDTIRNKATQMARQLTGIDSLLTKVGRCCQPLPGDKVMGYVTQQQGISIHRLDCQNLKRLSTLHPERLLEVNWAASDKQAYAIDIWVKAEADTDLLRELTGALISNRTQLMGVVTRPLAVNEMEIKLSLLISGIAELNQAIHVIKQFPAVKHIRRH